MISQQCVAYHPIRYPVPVACALACLAVCLIWLTASCGPSVQSIRAARDIKDIEDGQREQERLIALLSSERAAASPVQAEAMYSAAILAHRFDHRRRSSDLYRQLDALLRRTWENPRLGHREQSDDRARDLQRLRAWAIQAIGQLADPDHIDLLLDGLIITGDRDPQWRLRRAALDGLVHHEQTIAGDRRQRRRLLAALAQMASDLEHQPPDGGAMATARRLVEHHRQRHQGLEAIVDLLSEDVDDGETVIRRGLSWNYHVLHAGAVGDIRPPEPAVLAANSRALTRLAADRRRPVSRDARRLLSRYWPLELGHWLAEQVLNDCGAYDVADWLNHLPLADAVAGIRPAGSSEPPSPPELWADDATVRDPDLWSQRRRAVLDQIATILPRLPLVERRSAFKALTDHDPLAAAAVLVAGAAGVAEVAEAAVVTEWMSACAALRAHAVMTDDPLLQESLTAIMIELVAVPLTEGRARAVELLIDEYPRRLSHALLQALQGTQPGSELMASTADHCLAALLASDVPDYAGTSDQLMEVSPWRTLKAHPYAILLPVLRHPDQDVRRRVVAFLLDKDPPRLARHLGVMFRADDGGPPLQGIASISLLDEAVRASGAAIDHHQRQELLHHIADCITGDDRECALHALRLLLEQPDVQARFLAIHTVHAAEPVDPGLLRMLDGLAESGQGLEQVEDAE